MSKQMILTAIIALMIAVMPATTQAQSSSDLKAALERMSAIIAEMEKLRVEFTAIAGSTGQTPTPAVLGAQTNNTPVFTKPLVLGETNDDIARVQKLLATDPEIYPYGVVSGFFGPKTEEAIKNLQARNGWDTPGVVGPATKTLLEGYFKAYPQENWPKDVLKSKPPAPQVLGASTSNTPVTTGTPVVSGSNPAKKITVALDDGEALIEINYTNGNRKGLVADTDDKEEIVSFIASRTVLSEAMIKEVITYSGRSGSSKSSDADEEDAEDALDDAEKALEDAEEAIEEADDDGEDVDWAEETFEEAEDFFKDAEDAFDDEDYDEAVELAEEAAEMAEKAEDRIGEKKKKGSSKGDADDIDKIEVEIGDGESEVTVVYEDDEEDEFTVEEDKEDDIIEAIADELDLDEDEVEDLIEFDYGKVDYIEVSIDKKKGTALARVFYKSGAERRVRLSTTDEDEIIEDIAKEIDEDEDDVEDWVEFD